MKIRVFTVTRTATQQPLVRLEVEVVPQVALGICFTTREWQLAIGPVVIALVFGK